APVDRWRVPEADQAYPTIGLGWKSRSAPRLDGLRTRRAVVVRRPTVCGRESERKLNAEMGPAGSRSQALIVWPSWGKALRNTSEWAAIRRRFVIESRMSTHTLTESAGQP